MKHDYLKWGALAAALVATASAEYELARAVGFNQYVAAAVPAALDLYTVRALRAHKEVLAAVAAMIGVNAASHLVTTGLVPVNVWLVVAVAAIAPLVLWRVHSLADEVTTNRGDTTTVATVAVADATVAQTAPVAAPEVTTTMTVERVADDQPRALPEPHRVVPAEVELLPIVARIDPAPGPSPYRWDHVRGRLVDGQGDQEQPPATPDLVTSPWDMQSPDWTVPGDYWKGDPVLDPAPVQAAETAREVVTEVITLTPSELRRRASRLNRELVTSTTRTVTIDRLREEFGLTRREAAELRRQVVTPEGGERS